MAKQNFPVTSQRTTIARTLADLANPLVNSAMNTTNVAILLAETKDLALARTLLKRDWRYFRRHGAGAADPGPGDRAEPRDAGRLRRRGLQFQSCSPGHKLARSFVTDVSGAVCLSKVGGAIIAIDQTLTTLIHGKAELLGRVAENDDRAHSC